AASCRFPSLEACFRHPIEQAQHAKRSRKAGPHSKADRSTCITAPSSAIIAKKLNPEALKSMRKRLLLLAAVGICSSLFAQKPAWQPAPGHITLPVWPHGAPGAPPNLGPEIDTTTAKDNLIAGKPLIRLSNVSTPTLTLYAPKA